VQENERVLVLQNLSAARQELAWTMPAGTSQEDIRGNLIDLLTGQATEMMQAKAVFSLQPYEYRWLLIQP
jgi:hypothetical protein